MILFRVKCNEIGSVEMCNNQHSFPQHSGRCLEVYRGRLEGSLDKNKRNKNNYFEEETLDLEETAISSIYCLKPLLAYKCLYI